MMIYPGRWKTILIPSHGLDTSRTLFLVPTDISLCSAEGFMSWTPLKGLGLVSGCWVLLMSRVMAGCPHLACICHPQLQQSCQYVWNQSYIPCYHLGQEQEGLGLVLWQKVLDMVLVLVLLELSCRNISSCELFLPSDHWNDKWHTLFTIPWVLIS